MEWRIAKREVIQTPSKRKCFKEERERANGSNAAAKSSKMRAEN